MKRCILIFCTFCLHALYAQTRMGCVFDEQAYEQVLLAKVPFRGEELHIPNEKSLKKYTPTPKNQGNYGTCVAWTSAYYARGIMLAQKKQLSTQKQIDKYAGSPYFVYESIKSYQDKNCQEGAGLIIALEALKQNGTVSYQEFQKNCGQIITSEQRQKALDYKIGEYRRLFLANSKDKTTPIKKSLAQAKPVVIGLNCFFKSFVQAKDSLWKPTDKEIAQNDVEDGGHALTVVGYNDSLQAFEVVNSWGTNWANKGFIWIPYTYMNEICFEAYEMYETNEPASQIAGEVKLILSAGSSMPLRLKQGIYETIETYQIGTLFKMHLSNTEPVFVYAFTTDLLQESNSIFPFELQKSPLIYQDKQIILPDEEYIELQSKTNTSYLCVLYCKERLHLPSLLTQIQSLEGDMPARLQKILGTKLIPNEKISLDEAFAKFKSQSDEGSILPIIIAIKKRK